MWEFRVVSIHKKYKVICLSNTDCPKVTGTPETSGKLHKFFPPFGWSLDVAKDKIYYSAGVSLSLGVVSVSSHCLEWDFTYYLSSNRCCPDGLKWSHNGSLEASPEALPSSARASLCPVTSEARKVCWNINLLPSTLHMKLLHLEIKKTT